MDARMAGTTAATYAMSNKTITGAAKSTKSNASSINLRSKGILRFRKPARKFKNTNNIENDKQRTGLNSFLRTDEDI